MSLIYRCHLKYPFYGSPRIRGWLIDKGYCVNRKRAQRLMRTVGPAALYPGRNLSKANQAHTVYPYLQHNLIIDRSNQVSVYGYHLYPDGEGLCLSGCSD